MKLAWNNWLLQYTGYFVSFIGWKLQKIHFIASLIELQKYWNFKLNLIFENMLQIDFAKNLAKLYKTPLSVPTPLCLSSLSFWTQELPAQKLGQKLLSQANFLKNRQPSLAKKTGRLSYNCLHRKLYSKSILFKILHTHW